MSEISRFPLAWPHGRPRTPSRDQKRAAFGTTGSSGWKTELSVSRARERLDHELELIRATGVVLSTNIVLNKDGTPRSGLRDPEDVGVALYFTLDRRPIALACDKWDRIADNIAAIAKHIESLRGQDRWGVGSLEEAFTGYLALPAPGQATERHWRAVLGFGADERVDLESLSARYRERARAAQGDENALLDLNVARDRAREELGA